MKIQQVHEYAAAPASVWKTMSDRDVLEELCRSQHADSFEVTATDALSGVAVTVPSPDAVRRIVGPKLLVRQNIAWNPPAEHGSRTGSFSVEVPGAPVKAGGTVTIAPGGAGTLLEYDGDLTARVPLFGRQIEQAAAEVFLQVLSAQHEIVTQHLARQV